MRKIILLLIVLILVIPVNASDNITYYQKDTLIQYDSVNFTIPQGFGQNTSFLNDSTISFVNRDVDSINITVGHVKFEGNNTMFGSHSGYLNQTNSSAKFSYSVNDKNVSISAPNQQILLKVLGD